MAIDAATPPLTRLALVDDHPKLLAGLAAILGADSRYEVVATGGTAGEALAIALETKPDVMLVDLSMPGDIFAAIDTITRRSPTLKIVVFTAFANVELALKAHDAGAHGFVLKGRPTNDLFDAIEAVTRGELYSSPEFSPRIRDGFRHRPKVPSSERFILTGREQQIVDRLLLAETMEEIARSLELTDKTVRHAIAALKRKLGVKSRLELVQAIGASGFDSAPDRTSADRV
jgi:DNA-binding NarL/FixJ family response regulator